MTPTFVRWLDGLRDRVARKRIVSRLDVLRDSGTFGVTRSVGSGVWEIKLSFGPGYRLYYKLIGKQCTLLLAGGDKSSQAEDILEAKRLAREFS